MRRGLFGEERRREPSGTIYRITDEISYYLGCLEIPSRFIIEYNVVGFIPSFSAAPSGPLTRHPVR